MAKVQTRKSGRLLNPKKIGLKVSVDKMRAKPIVVQPAHEIAAVHGWKILYSASVHGPDAGGAMRPVVFVASRDIHGRLEIDLNDGRIATVFLEPGQLYQLGLAAIAGAFELQGRVAQATGKHGKKKRRG